MAPFYTRCLETASVETRAISVKKDPLGMPDGTYLLTEWYCDDPGCDCRRVLLQVHRHDNPNPVFA